MGWRFVVEKSLRWLVVSGVRLTAYGVRANVCWCFTLRCYHAEVLLIFMIV